MSRSAYPTKHEFRHVINGMDVTKLGKSVILILYNTIFGFVEQFTAVRYNPPNTGVRRA